LSYRIQRSVVNNTVTLAVSGTVNATRAADLQSRIEREPDVKVVLDLRDVTLVERDAVPLLGGMRTRGAELVNCPEYLRLWMVAESDSAPEDVER
jgi:anti-anti-sigma regulatory factor